MIGEKLGGYIVYGDAYRDVAQNAGKEDFLVPYIWGKTPKLGRDTTGSYATSLTWPDYVEEKYQKYSREEQEDDRVDIHDYEMLLMGYDKKMLENKDTVQYEFVYTNGVITAEIKSTN